MNILLDLTIVFSLSAVILYISSRLNVPTVVGLLLSGFIAGPYALGLIEEKSAVEDLAEIGVLLLLFTIGMEFSLKKLFENKTWILVGGGIQVFGTILLVSVLSLLFGMSYVQAVFLGALFAMSSTAIVLSIFQEKGWINRAYGKSVLSVLIFQDIIIIPIMLAVPFVAGDNADVSDALMQLGTGVGIVIVVLLAARKLVPVLLEKIVHARNQELFLMSILVICFATAFITYQLGLKLALGAFLAGLIVSESDYSYDAIKNILPLKKIFISIFFLSVGMLLNGVFLVEHLLPIIALVAAVIVVKFLIVTLLGIRLKLSVKDAMISGIALCQVGEFAFILSKVGNDYNILDYNAYQTFLAVSIISMAVTPFFIIAAPKLTNRLINLSWLSNLATRWKLELRQPVNMCSKEDHVVVIGFGPIGRQVVNTVKSKGMNYAIIEYESRICDYCRELGEPIYAGDAQDPDVLKKAAVEAAKTIVITTPEASTTEHITVEVRKLAPHAHIIVRSDQESEAEILTRLGADEVVPTEIEAGRGLAERLMLVN
ncbi:MAG: cation:proton antiporter [Bacteroidota bacterium]